MKHFSPSERPPKGTLSELSPAENPISTLRVSFPMVGFRMSRRSGITCLRKRSISEYDEGVFAKIPENQAAKLDTDGSGCSVSLSESPEIKLGIGLSTIVRPSHCLKMNIGSAVDRSCKIGNATKCQSTRKTAFPAPAKPCRVSSFVDLVR